MYLQFYIIEIVLGNVVAIGFRCCVPNFTEIGTQEGCLCMHLSFGANKKNTKKIQWVSGTNLLLNLVCKVLYVKV